jgi:hypothetical protein
MLNGYLQRIVSSTLVLHPVELWWKRALSRNHSMPVASPNYIQR